MHARAELQRNTIDAPSPCPVDLSTSLQLANVLNNEQLFYTCIFPFIAFFGAFAFVLYPMQEMLHPTGADWTFACVVGLAWHCGRQLFRLFGLLLFSMRRVL